MVEETGKPHIGIIDPRNGAVELVGDVGWVIGVERLHIGLFVGIHPRCVFGHFLRRQRPARCR